MRHALTKRQGECYTFIRAYIKDKEMSPSYLEIAKGVGFSCLAEVYDMIKRLEARGYISRLKGKILQIRLFIFKKIFGQNMIRIRQAKAPWLLGPGLNPHLKICGN